MTENIRTFWERNNQPHVWLMLAMVVVFFLPTILFRFLFIDVRSVTLSPTTLEIEADRSIRWDFEGSFSVQVRNPLTHEVICRGSSEHTFPYRKDASARNPLTMNFWKWSGIRTDTQKRFCRAQGMVEGAPIYIVTCHYAHAPWGVPWGRRCVTSDTAPVPAGFFADLDAETRHQAHEIERLSTQIVGRTPEGWHRADMAEWVAEFKRTGQPPDPYQLPSYLDRVE